MGNLIITLNCTHPAKHHHYLNSDAGNSVTKSNLFGGDVGGIVSIPNVARLYHPGFALKFRNALFVNLFSLHVLALIILQVKMPSATLEIPPYSYVPETKENLDWADCKFQTTI
jgi:hypothetical protein